MYDYLILFSESKERKENIYDNETPDFSKISFPLILIQCVHCSHFE